MNYFSYITVYYDVQKAGKFCVEAIKSLEENFYVSNWMLMEVFPPLKTFPYYNHRLLSSVNSNFSLYDNSINPYFLGSIRGCLFG